MLLLCGSVEQGRTAWLDFQEESLLDPFQEKQSLLVHLKARGQDSVYGHSRPEFSRKDVRDTPA